MIDYLFKQATRPLSDTYSLLKGLSEGEIRKYAAARLGADFITGMAIGEIIDALEEYDNE